MATINGTFFNDTLNGTAEADVINGAGGNDTISGNGGDDTITGGMGTDRFKFAAGDGKDTIKDLTAGETVEIRGYSSAQSITQVGTSVVVVFSITDQITFYNTTVATVSAALQFPDGGSGGTTINGTEFDDTLNGTSGDDTINGLGGYDTINGLAGNDTISGGYGGDTIDGGDGNDTLNGGDGRDYIHGSAGDDVIYAGDSDNFEFPEFIWDGPGNDIVYGEGSQDIIYGSPGNDHYDGGTSGTQSFEGDQVHYTNALAAIYVDMRLSSGQVRSLGEADPANIGVDTLVNVEGITGSAFDDVMIGGDTGIAFGGGAGNDQLTGGAARDLLNGHDGKDTLHGGGDNDQLVGDLGDDILVGGTGDDLLMGGEGVDTFKFVAGNDKDTIADLTAGEIVEIRGYASAQSITQVGSDVVVVLSETDQITFSNTDVATVEAALQFEDAPPPSGGIDGTGGDDTLTGTSGNDTINGLGGADTINGLAGDDIIYGNEGHDTLNGGAGNDTLDGGAGNDTMKGGTGNDVYIVESSGDVVTELANQGIDEVHSTISYTLGANVENGVLEGTAAINLTGNALVNNLRGNAAVNTLSGGAGNDVLDGMGGADNLIGGTGNDIYYVDNVGDRVTERLNAGTDEVRTSINYALSSNVENGTAIGNSAVNLTGNQQANTLTGNHADNFLYGMAGNDVLIGGAGNDTLRGGLGVDTLTGGAGADFFVFEKGGGNDKVTDFVSGTDKIDLSLVTGVTMANVKTAVSNGNTIVSVDANNDGFADFTITLTGVTQVQTSDFIFG